MKKRSILLLSIIVVILAFLLFNNNKEESDRESKILFAEGLFKRYNTNIDSETIHLFVSVCEKFGLDTGEVFFISIGQICTESGAKHYKGGKILKSVAGALGIAQITPATAYDFLKKVPHEELIYWQNEFGCSYPDFIKKSYNKDSSFKWLTKIENNIVLWGFIMSEYIKAGKSVDESLFIYNVGMAGYKKRIKLGVEPSKYRYVKKIKKIVALYNNEQEQKSLL
jgi:hypothetical protein